MTSRDPTPTLLGPFRRVRLGPGLQGRWGRAFFGGPPARRPCVLRNRQAEVCAGEPEGLGLEKDRAAGWRGFWWNRFGNLSQGPARTGCGFCRQVSSWEGVSESLHPWVHPVTGRRESLLLVGAGHALATLNSAVLVGSPVGRELQARFGSGPSQGLVPHTQKVASCPSLEEADGPQSCLEGTLSCPLFWPHPSKDARTPESPHQV